MIDKIKKGSILRKMIFLNTINIIVVVLAIVSIVIIFIFNEFEKSLISETEVSVKTFSNVFRNIGEELSKKAGKYSKDRDVILAVTKLELKEDIYKEVKKEVLGNGKILYSYMYTDISGNTKYSMKRLANLLIDYITGGGRRFGINELFLSLIDSKGKNIGTSMLVPEQKQFDNKDNSPFINDILNIGTPFKSVTTDIYTDVEATDDGLVVRGGMALKFDKESAGAIIVSQVVEKEMTNYISSQIKMKKSTRVFFLKDNKYLTGELELEKGDVMFSRENAAKKMKDRDYFSDSIKVKNESFITAYYPIKDFKGKVIGYMGIANSKSELNRTKFLAIIIIASVSLFIIILGAILNTIISYRIAKPLMKLQVTANRIAAGRYGEIFEKSEETNEISELSSSLQNMLDKINDNMRKLRAIEEVVSIIHSENNEEKVLFYILSVIVSKNGLNCKTAAYFNLNSEKNLLEGKSCSYSERIQQKKLIDIFDIEDDEIKNYTSKIKDVVINIGENEFIRNIISDKKVVYSDSENISIREISVIGFSEMFIIPIIYENNTYGLMFIESGAESSNVFDDDSDIVNLFTTNLAIYFENKRLEHESLKTEKLTTMIKMASSIVHELRTPLTSIRGFADMLRKSYLTDNKVQRYTQFIIKDSQRIDSLAEDLLDYSDGSIEKYEKEIIELKKIIANILEELNGDILANNIQLEFDVPADVKVDVDIIKFRKAIYNIIKNSIEASKGINDRIVIRIVKDNKRIFLKVMDNGVGIPKDIIEMVFEPLVSTKIQGTGLGLTIAKDILNNHGFTLSIKSEKNVGTEISIAL